MRFLVHLVSMPWARPDAPSIQLGALKADLDREFQGRVVTRQYSAFLGISYRLFGDAAKPMTGALGPDEEYPYMLAYQRRFAGQGDAAGDARFTSLVEHYLRQRKSRMITPDLLGRLTDATDTYLDSHLGPQLVADGLNVVGFTLNYYQAYASIYAVSYLRQTYPNHRFCFIFGGATASYLSVIRLLNALSIPGLLVVGEGEPKLRQICHTLLSGQDTTNVDEALCAIPGVVRVSDGLAWLANRERSMSQLSTIDDLAAPDYDEFYAEVDRRGALDARAPRRRATQVLVEGSRGCFAKCDFCGLNSSWQGFRKRSPMKIFATCCELLEKYGAGEVHFVDNVCDTFAGPLADQAVQANHLLPSFMELRVHHQESFWTKLAMSGARSVQIGIEALSAPLLRAMRKGTTVTQNLAVHKYLTELGVESAANLIVEHPLSTAVDVLETRRVLEYIPHLPPFDLVHFGLVPGSPLYEALSFEEQLSLGPRCPVELPAEVSPFALDLWFASPPGLKLAPEVAQAWADLKRWYRRQRSVRPRPANLKVERSGTVLVIFDDRFGAARRYELTGNRARVFDCCHDGPRPSVIAERLGLSASEVERTLDDLAERKWVLRLDGHALALATRSRSELVKNLFLSRERVQSSGRGVDRVAVDQFLEAGMR